MNEFIAYLVKNLVDKPESVQVQTSDNSHDLIVSIQVSKEDVSKVIGRQGRIIKSLRIIALTIGARLGKRIRLELME
ncbi:MAG: KH domain-containing protein [Verrucomicrobia bacterium]|nr:KH domain-containing protein [Verrucomicrobiota bacterium]